MFSFKYFAKIFLLTLLSVIILFLGIIGYFVVNQAKIANNFVHQFQTSNSLPFSYSTLDFSITKNFPYASIVIEDFTLQYPKSVNDTLLNINELLLSINTIGLINGNYYINNVILNSGRINLIQSKIDQLEELFISENSNDSASQSIIQFDRAKFNSININYFAKSNKKPVQIQIDEAAIQFQLTQKMLNLQFKLEGKNPVPKLINDNREIFIEGALSKVDEHWSVEVLNAKMGSLSLSSNGSYSFDKGVLNLHYWSNSFKLKRIASMLGIEQIQGGQSCLDGDLVLNANNGTVDYLVVNYASRNIQILTDSVEIKCNSLVGHSEFWNNFERQFSVISNFSMDEKGLILNGSAKIEGFNELSINGDVDFKLYNYSTIKQNLGLDLKANGGLKFLALANLSNNNSAVITFKALSGNADFEIENNSLFSPAKQITGSIAIDKSLNIKANCNLNSRKVDVNALVTNSIDVINTRSISSINASVNAKFIDIDMLLNDIDKVSSNSIKNKNSISYNIKYEFDTLLFLDKRIEAVSGKLFIKDDYLKLNDLRTRVYSGSVCGDVTMLGDEIDIDAQMFGVDVSQMFADNKNFSQNLISSTDINGELKADFKLKFRNDGGKIDRQSLLLDGSFDLADGKLRGMNKVKKMEKWLNLDEVESIDFSNLRNQIIIKNGVVFIPSMSIKSNVMDITLDGKHSFDGNFEYHTRLNISRLFANRFMNRDATSDFENDAQNNHFVNLVIVGNSDDYRVKRDKERTRERLKSEAKTEGELLKKIVKEEFNLKKDTIKRVDTLKNNDSGFRIEWDE